MKILFVCTGNTCRSPMAEAIVHTRNIEGMEARSAGIYVGQAPLSANARKVLSEQSIKFDHTSKPLNPRDVEWAELILTMTILIKHSTDIFLVEKESRSGIGG